MKRHSVTVALQRFLVEQVRDTRLSIARRSPSSAVAKAHLREHLQLWWVDSGVPARLEVVEARLRWLTERVRR
ncbi:MAG: hypothetical protein INH41_29885 [Myxococcaceae bacterium]|jgi:hypothetical protein|nr:hypothetical protein [Myxococcaceae bacterium]